LLDRLLSWPPLLKVLDEETAEFSPEQFVLIDPDSRFLQLGLLPALADESRYFFFESRCTGADTPKNLSQLTLDWLNATFGSSASMLPRLWLQEKDAVFGKTLAQGLRHQGARFLAAISFGVGGNASKRLTESFEEQLLLRFLEEGCTVLLDKGAGDEELSRTNRIADLVRNTGRSVEPIDPASSISYGCRKPLPSVLVWQGGIGPWAGLIGACDEYIGYDSSGQHLASAQNIPTVDIFTENSTPVFRQRWGPAGRQPSLAIVAGSSDRSETAMQAVLSEVIAAHRKIQPAHVTKNQKTGESGS
jgi:ADP-heptose:LPS heptosyltransferase